MTFDFKITAWERVEVPKELESEILEKIKAGEIKSSNDIFNIEKDCSYSIIPDTDEPMSPQENGGMATIEVVEGSKIIFNNATTNSMEQENPKVLPKIYGYEDKIINKIQKITKKHGMFTVYGVDADHSPFLDSKGNLVFLVEEFNDNDALVRVYDPTSSNSDMVDEYYTSYEDISKEQLEYILKLAEQWENISI